MDKTSLQTESEPPRTPMSDNVALHPKPKAPNEFTYVGQNDL